MIVGVGGVCVWVWVSVCVCVWMDVCVLDVCVGVWEVWQNSCGTAEFTLQCLWEALAETAPQVCGRGRSPLSLAPSGWPGRGHTAWCFLSLRGAG